MITNLKLVIFYCHTNAADFHELFKESAVHHANYQDTEA